MQEEQSGVNERAWNQSPYNAWVNRYGAPNEAAAKIKKDPPSVLKSLYQHIGDLKGKKVVNLLGSHGHKAVALALLGSNVTVVDIASENARYANQLAQNAGVSMRYIVADVLDLPESELTSDYEIVLMELGILHYFIDLHPLMQIVAGLLNRGGRLVLQDFHPVTTKLITSKGKRHTTRKHKVTGDYFDASLEEADVPYVKFLPDVNPADYKKTLIRRWNLGEIVTAVASAGLYIKLLEEEPNTSSEVYDKGIPKTFTLVAEKI
jgi:2-polyprenyl-3-methyl-5-hydroxy-6-metoxy-1,4-benzoquinol methylase